MQMQYKWIKKIALVCNVERYHRFTYICLFKFLHIYTVLCSTLTRILHMGSSKNRWHIFTVLGKSELKAGSVQHKTDCNRLKIAPKDCRNCYKGQTEKKQLQGDEICGVNFGAKFPLEFGVIQGRLGGFATIAAFPKAFSKNGLP